MENTEKDKVLANFKRDCVRVLISTGYLARDIFVPDVRLVINYEVPITTDYGEAAENYRHRIRIPGLLGAKAIAVTLLDTDEDKNDFNKIVFQNGMEHNLIPLEDAE